MSQIIAHNRYPQASVGTGTARDGSTMDLNITYDYDNMLDSYTTGNYTDEQAKAASLLNVACGYAAYMDYGLDASGTASQYAATAFKDNFLYPNVEFLSSNLYSKTEWGEIIYDNLSHGYPIFYAGTARDSGHAFVLDGYEYADGNDYYHFNWGWNSYYNGYFLIDYMLPAGYYHRYQGMIVNIVPSTDSYSYNVTRSPYISNISLDDNGMINWTIYGPVVGESSFITGYYAENINDTTDNFTFTLEKLDFTQGGVSGYIYELELTDNDAAKLSAGKTYKFTPLYRSPFDDVKEFKAIPYDQASNCGYFLATIADGGATEGITFTIPSVTMPKVQLNELSAPIYLNKDSAITNIALSGTITNNSSEEIYQIIRPLLLKRTDSSLSIVGAGQPYLVWMQPGESKELSLTTDFNLPDNFTAGNYGIAFAPYNYSYTVSNLIDAEVHEYPGFGTLEITKFTTGYANEQVPADDIAFDVQLTCTEGIYDYYSFIYLYIYDNISGSWQQTEYYYYYYMFNIPAGQTASYRQAFTPQNVKAGMRYIAVIYNFTYEDGKYSSYEAARIQSTFGASAGTTGIDDITTDATAPDINLPVYDLTGRMVAPRLADAQLPAGIYIVGNKKISIR
jgi:hypothetical protein